MVDAVPLIEARAVSKFFGTVKTAQDYFNYWYGGRVSVNGAASPKNHNSAGR